MGGLAIGIVQLLLTRYAGTGGRVDAAPFVVLVGVTALRGKALPARGKANAIRRLVGEIRLTPLLIWIIIGVACLTWLLPGSYINASITMLVFAIVALSSVVITGYAGQLSLGQLPGRRRRDSRGEPRRSPGWPFALALLVGMCVAAASGLVLGASPLFGPGASIWPWSRWGSRSPSSWCFGTRIGVVAILAA